MGNKLLRPHSLEPLAGFNEDQLSYLKDKFQILSQENQYLSAQKIAQELCTSSEQAQNILNYIDFSGKGQVDFYEFVCAAASLHQSDSEAQEFIFEIYAGKDDKITQQQFYLLYATVFKYLSFLDIHNGVRKQKDEVYDEKIAEAKFKQYDYNHNGSLDKEEFSKMLQNDWHCRTWMESLGFVEQREEQKDQKIINTEIPADEFAVVAEGGEQFQAVEAWRGVVDRMCPDQYKNSKPQNKTPNCTLDIEYVYGYRSYDTRDNLRYNKDGQIVYHTAACGIILNKSKNTMKINTAHNDDITCLDVNIKCGIVATGEMGKRPAIVIWDAFTSQTKFVISKELERSISNIAISKSGKYVAATSMSDKHQIAVYDISSDTPKLVAFGVGPRSVIFAIKFNNQQTQVICACEKQVVFAKFSAGKIQLKKGVFGKAPLNPNLSVAIVGDAVVTSMANGLLLLWKGNFVSKVIKQHSKAITAICERNDGGLISGDLEGRIIIWSSNLSKEKEILLEKILGNTKSNNLKIISIYQQNGCILVGTRGGEIIEITKGSNANVLMEGHFDKQLWGLCVSSNKNQFFTGGQDKLLLKWDAVKRRLVNKKKVEYPIKCIDVNKANLVAVGQKNGVVLLLDGNTFKEVKKIAQLKNPDKQIISALKFSVKGSILAVGYCPPYSKVVLYDITAEKPKKIGECKGASCRITTIDFSTNDEAVLCTSIEPLFYKTSNGSQIQQVSSLKNEEWATMNSKFTWFTQGIWPPCSDGSDVNWTDRSNDKSLLATADDFSKVKIFKYPVCTKRQLYNEFKGHSSHVTSLKWAYDDSKLFSAGGLQKSIIQWLVKKGEDYDYDYEEKQEKQDAENVEDEQGLEQNLNEEDQKLQEKIKSKKIKKEGEDGEFQLEEDEGQQALAIKPFQGQVKASTPSKYDPPKSGTPDIDLVLKHAWGVRNLYINDKVRNQVRYGADHKSCFFITAALGVQMDLQSREQTFYQGQSEDLISFAISKDRSLCATGQMAQLNKDKPTSKIVDVHIWDAKTKQLKAKLSKFHQRAVVWVQFSPSGKKILTIGQDDKNSLAVYDWASSKILWSSPVDGAKVTGASWKNQSQYMTVGLKHVKLWTEGKGAMCKPQGKWDPMYCCVYWQKQNKFVSGSASGSVYVWSGNNGTATKAHQDGVDCLGVDLKGNLYSGCRKGIISVLKLSGGKLTIDKKLYDMSKIDEVDPGILSFDFTKEKVLVCTNSSSIYNLSLTGKEEQTEPITTGHYKGELWAESWSRDRKRFVTAGDDYYVRMYNIQDYKQLYSIKMPQKVRGIDWQQSQGELIIVGDYRGNIHLLDSKLSLVQSVKTKFGSTKLRQQSFWIEDIKFSPNGKFIAFGAHGGASHIEVYELNGSKINTKPSIIKAGMTSALLSIDWSTDSQNLVAVSQAYELKFTNHDKDISASSCKDVKWASWSGKFGFCVKQVHQDVEYNKINCVCWSPSKNYILTGGDDQKIKIFNYPVIQKKQPFKQLIGHSSHVCKVRFSADEKYLLSVGGNDRTTLLWENKAGEAEIIQEKKQEDQGEQQPQEDEAGDEQEDVEDIEDYPRARQQAAKAKPKNNQDQFEVEEDDGQQFMAIKPWLGAIKQPAKQYYKSSGKVPKAELNLQFAHGYRTKDCKNNLRYLNSDEICYHTAGLGIIMNLSKRPLEQQFFDLHNDDVISIAWNGDQIFTSEMGAKPSIFRWDKNCKKLQEYKGAKKGVSALAVNQKYLVGSGLDDDHYLYLFDVEKGNLIVSEKGGRDVIVGLKWTSESNFVSVGAKHFKEWSFSGKALKGKNGSFKSNNNLLCCVEVSGGNAYTGAANGSLYKWAGTEIHTSKKLHQKAIHALCIKKNVVLTGSHDQSIKILNLNDLSELASIDCKKVLYTSLKPSIRALDILDDKILVGTLASQIYQIKCSKKVSSADSSTKFELKDRYMTGHFSPNFVTNQVWGLALYADGEYITCGDDATIKVWDIKSKEQIMCFNIMDIADSEAKSKAKQKDKDTGGKFLPDSCKGRCLAVYSNEDDKYVVVGCKDGTVRILKDSKGQFKQIQSKRLSQKQISHIKFSPDQSKLAIGSHDCKIYLFEWSDIPEKDKILSNKAKILAKHSSYIKHFDFSQDSNTLHSTCGAYELLFWDVNTGKQLTGGATATRDEVWATWNVTLGWPVQGIWEKEMDGTDVNAVDRSHRQNQQKMRLLASGDDNGKVRLLQYPSVVKNSAAVYGRGHSSHVTCVLFDPTDDYIFSTGGEDQTVLQWTVGDKW